MIHNIRLLICYFFSKKMQALPGGQGGRADLCPPAGRRKRQYAAVSTGQRQPCRSLPPRPASVPRKAE